MISSYFWGLYPYSEEALYDMYDGTVETSLPSEQTVEMNTFTDDPNKYKRCLLWNTSHLNSFSVKRISRRILSSAMPMRCGYFWRDTEHRTAPICRPTGRT